MCAFIPARPRSSLCSTCCLILKACSRRSWPWDGCDAIGAPGGRRSRNPPRPGTGDYAGLSAAPERLGFEPRGVKPIRAAHVTSPQKRQAGGGAVLVASFALKPGGEFRL